MSLTPLERSTLAIALWNIADEVETGTSPVVALRLMAAILCGKVTGGPSHPDFKGIGVNAVRVHMEADANGNRTVVTLTP